MKLARKFVNYFFKLQTLNSIVKPDGNDMKNWTIITFLTFSRASQSTFGRWSIFRNTQEMCPCLLGRRSKYTNSNARKNIENINDLAD
jgi:hypothetical protein